MHIIYATIIMTTTVGVVVVGVVCVWVSGNGESTFQGPYTKLRSKRTSILRYRGLDRKRKGFYSGRGFFRANKVRVTK